MPRVFVGCGSNVDRENNLKAALTKCRDRFGGLTISPCYQSRAKGTSGADYFNLVIAFESTEDAAQIVHDLKLIEASLERKRGNNTCSIDLDLLLYGDAIIENDNFSVPRADVLRDAFVLKPLADIAPQGLHPISQKTYTSLWSKMAQEGVTLIDVTAQCRFEALD